MALIFGGIEKQLNVSLALNNLKLRFYRTVPTSCITHRPGEAFHSRFESGSLLGMVILTEM